MWIQGTLNYNDLLKEGSTGFKKTSDVTAYILFENEGCVHFIDQFWCVC